MLNSIKNFTKSKLKATTTVVHHGCAVPEHSQTESKPKSTWVKTASGWIVGNQASLGAKSDSEPTPLVATHSEKHGSMGDRSWQAPNLVTFCQVQARPGYDSCEAHEYEDVPDVLQEKVTMFADLIKKSRCTILYTGAGISTASGISDYATRSTNRSETSDKVVSPLSARPTKSHRVLTALYRSGLIKGWVQQNHDGLPQKAGFPQSAINGKLNVSASTFVPSAH